MESQLQLAKQHIEAGEIEVAHKILDSIVAKDDATPEVFLSRGLIHFRKQNWGDAINDFTRVIELDPDNSEARHRMEMAKNILGYFTPDMFNP
jgi:Flp pilus assembly protein TadD, contains TPR repeats